jgi:hypothetical protein
LFAQYPSLVSSIERGEGHKVKKTSSRNESQTHSIKLQNGLRFLSPDQILMIDEMLDKVAPFGEVTLRVKDGKLKFVAQSKSFDALKLQRPNALNDVLNNDK